MSQHAKLRSHPVALYLGQQLGLAVDFGRRDLCRSRRLHTEQLLRVSRIRLALLLQASNKPSRTTLSST